MKKVLGIMAVVVSTILMSGCACEHDWEDATCTKPKTCSLCEETEGQPYGHVWVNATCIEPKTCSVCSKTEGELLGHDWTDATCTEPKTCSVCAEIEGDALGHVWDEATCEAPKTCSVCAEVEGVALGHDIPDGKVTKEATCTETGITAGLCNNCGETVETDIPLKEHIAGDWEVTVTPTKDSKGTRIKKCTVCEKELEKEQFSLTPEELEQMYKDQCESIGYDKLARTPKDYEGKQVKFSGEVVQVCSEASSILYYSTYRIATKGGYDNVVYALIDNYGTGVRILEDDKITIYGEFVGLYTYETVMGASVTIPKIEVAYYD